MQYNAIFQIWHDCHTHELKAAVITCAKSSQPKFQHVCVFTRGISRSHPSLRSYWQLVAAEKGESFFLEGVAICRQPFSSECPHPHAHVGSTNWLMCYQIKDPGKGKILMAGGYKGSWQGNRVETIIFQGILEKLSIGNSKTFKCSPWTPIFSKHVSNLLTNLIYFTFKI